MSIDFSLSELAEAHLAVQRDPTLVHALIQRHSTVTVWALVELLIEQAVSDDAQGEHDDAAAYALLAAQLIAAFELHVS